MKKIFFSIVLLSSIVFTQTIPVTFQVDMGAQVAKGIFVPGTDQVVVRGSFQADAGDPGGNWQGAFFTGTDPDGDTIYTVIANLPVANVGTLYEYKFVKAPDSWEGSPNRTFTLASPSMILPVYWFNDDSAYVTLMTNTLNFTADLTGIYGSGVGYFDPNSDSIQVEGLDWDGLGTIVSGERRLYEDPLAPGFFTTSISFKGVLSDSTKWKFRAYPEARFTNTGWETGGDRWYIYGPEGTTVNLDPIVPRIYPSSGPLVSPVNVLFQVNMVGAVNRYNGSTINPATLIFAGVKGGSKAIGDWSGNWVVADTVTQTTGYPYITVLNDAGINGDKIAGDNVWSKIVTFPDSSQTGAIEFKFTAYYPNADTINGGTTPLDNEGGFGENHIFILRPQTSTIELRNNFGDFLTSVKENPDLTPETFSLLQNYPNPFNPSTTISYTVAKDGFVTLKVYNIMGEEVAILMNNVQKAGGYDVSFDASRLSTGVYFYTLNTGSFTATKKMMLIK